MAMGYRRSGVDDGGRAGTRPGQQVMVRLDCAMEGLWRQVKHGVILGFANYVPAFGHRSFERTQAPVLNA